MHTVPMSGLNLVLVLLTCTLQHILHSAEDIGCYENSSVFLFAGATETHGALVEFVNSPCHPWLGLQASDFA